MGIVHVNLWLVTRESVYQQRRGGSLLPVLDLIKTELVPAIGGTAVAAVVAAAAATAAALAIGLSTTGLNSSPLSPLVYCMSRCRKMPGP